MRISLNGNDYMTPPDSPVVPYLIDPLAVALRDTGVQRRSDFTKYNRLVFNDWTKYGIGWQRMRRDRNRGTHGMRDVDAETRWESGIYLPYLNQDATDATTFDLSRLGLEFKNNFYAFGEHDGGANSKIRPVVTGAFVGSTTTYGAATVITDGSGSTATERFLDAVAKNNNVWVLFTFWSGAATWHRVRYSADLATWNNPTANLPTGLASGATDGEDTDRGVIVELNGTLYVFLFDNASTGNEIEVHKTADEGATAWTSVTQVQSAGGPTGRAVWLDLNGDPAPVIGTQEGVYALDVSASVLQKLLSLPLDANNCRGLFVAQGKLYVPTGKGGMYELSLLEAGVISARIMDFPGPDGLITARQGYVTGPVALSDRWAFIPYGGHAAGKQASILVYDLLSRSEKGQDVTHSFYYHPTANQRIMWCALSGRDDAIMRLHFGVRTAAGTTDERFIAVPLDDPASGATISYEADGYVEIAEDDMGDPHANGAVYAAVLEADDLSAADTGEYVEHEYGVNGAAWTNVSNLGNFVSGDKTLWFGRTNQNITGQTEAGTSIGVAALTFRARLVLNRAATATNSPKIREYELRAYKNLAVGLQGYVVEIDLKATEAQLGVPVETVISRLETVFSSNTLVTFSYGDSGTLYVRAAPTRLGSLFTEPDSTRPYGRRRGVVQLQLERILE